MVDTIKFSQMPSAGNINNNTILPSLQSGENVIFNIPWAFLPSGSTANRPIPSSTINYRLRFNTDEELYEYYNAALGEWIQLQQSAFTDGPFIIYTADPSIPQGQNLGALANGILKQTIISGSATLNIAVNGTDYYGPSFTGYFESPAGVKDINGNIVLAFLSVGSSANNYLTLTNAIDPGGVVISADGVGSNIDVTVTGKGTGAFAAQSQSGSIPFYMEPNILSNIYRISFSIPTITANRIVTWPDASGTVAFAGSSAETFDGDSGTATPSSGVIKFTGGTSGLTFTGSSNTMAIGGILTIANGGTSVSSVTVSPTATSWAGWDSNKNLSMNNSLLGYSTTVNSGGTTTLTVSSTFNQFFTGSSNQIVQMPVVSTLVLGQGYYIVNNSSGTLTVQSSGGNTIVTMAPNTTAYLTCILTSGTTSASWFFDYQPEGIILPLSLLNGGTGTSLTASNGGIVYSASSSLEILSATSTANQIILSGSNSAPSWSTATYLGTLTANELLYASSSNTMAQLATANNSVLITSNTGVPSLSSTLPLAVQSNITQLGILTSNLVLANGIAIQPDTTSGDNILFQAYDNTNSIYRTFLTLTNGNIPNLSIAAPTNGTITIDGSIIGSITPAAGSFTTLNLTGSTPTLNFNGTTSSSVTTLSGTSGTIGTSAPPFSWTTGSGGNSLSIFAGGNAANFTLTTGNGGTTSDGTPGTGGTINFIAGNAGSSTAASGFLGGAFNITAGKGYTLTAGSSTAGGGGLINITAGPGGDQQGTGIGGTGGGILLTGGNPGASTNANGGNGGSVSFQNGPGGNATSTNGNGGASGIIRTFNNPGGNGLGSGSGGNGGPLNLFASKGGNGGSLGQAGNGGNTTIEGGASGNGASPGTAGNVSIIAGAASTLLSGSTNGGNSGNVTFSTPIGGSAVASTGGNGGNSGLISFTTGAGANAPSGTNSNGGNSGPISFITGNGGNPTGSGNGGNASDITLMGGNGGITSSGTSGNGANINLICGNAGAFGGATPGLNGNLKITNFAATWIWATADLAGTLNSDGFGNLSFVAPTIPLYDPGYYYGGILSKVSNSVYNISAVWCIDSTNDFNMSLPSGLNIDVTTTGAGGLDTGSFTAGDVYNSYVIGGTFGSSGILSLSSTGPSLPVGYAHWRWNGLIYADSSANIVKLVGSGLGSYKKYFYDFAVSQGVLSSGTASSQTSIGTLTTFAPNNGHIAEFRFEALFVPTTATDIARITPHGFNAALNGPVISLGGGTIINDTYCATIDVQPGDSFGIDYLISPNNLGTSALTLNLVGFNFQI